MKSVDNVGLIFANMVVGRGIADHVINITLGAFQFTPTDDGKVDNDLVVTGRLRLTKGCAKQLRDTLVTFLAEVEHAESAALHPTANGHDRTSEDTLN